MAWNKALMPGAVICCRFPEEERAGLPGRKVRPVIITKVMPGNQFRKAMVEVAFGTSSTKHVKDPNIQLSHCEELQEAGLHQPTKFLLRKRALIPATNAFIIRSKKEEVALGYLPARALAKLSIFLERETEEQRAHALRFGRRPAAPTWTPSSEQHKEIIHA